MRSLIALLVFAAPALADDAARLKELLAEAARGPAEGLRERVVSRCGGLEDPALRAKALEAVDPILVAAALRPRIGGLAKELAELGAKAEVEPGGPAWLRGLCGAEPLRLFDRLVGVSLYMNVNAHAKDYRLNVRIDDAWVERLAGLPDLRRLDLENTNVRGPALKAVGTLRQLESLNLTLCPVTDAFFAPLAELPRLRVLGLASTKVTGTGLGSLQARRQLENLNCHSAPVDDAGLACIGKLGSLLRLEIVHTQFSDAGTDALAGLLRLERLQLGSRKASGAGLAVLARLPRLQELDVHDGLLSLEGFRHVAAVETLRVLRAYGGSGGDAGLRALAGHPRLESLVLEGNGITDAGLPALSSLPNLRKLVLRESRVSEGAVDALRRACPSVEISR